MSTKYKLGYYVPTEVLCKRMRELVIAITAGDSGISMKREFTMRIPAELDRDADLVIGEAARRLIKQESKIEALQEENRIAREALERVVDDPRTQNNAAHKRIAREALKRLDND